MHRRILCLVLLVILALGLIALPVCADETETIFFTAINNTLLELTAETMPVKYNSMIYVPCSVFNSTELGTYALYSRENQKALVSDGERFLYFDMSAGNSYDSDGNSYYYVAIYQNGTAYIPAYFAATHFGLTYSYIRKNGQHMVRLVKGTVLSDDTFFDAASNLMEKSLILYYRSQSSPTPLPSALPTAVPTAVPPVTPAPTRVPSVSPTPAEVNHSDITVYLHILGVNENSSGILDTLIARGVPACFYATAQEVTENSDFIRRLLGCGYRLGVRFQQDPETEYSAFADALRNTAMDVSFLAAAEGSLSEDGQLAAEALGLHLCSVSMIQSDVDFAMLYLSFGMAQTDLYLDGTFSEMNRLLRRISQEKYNVMPVSETS